MAASAPSGVTAICRESSSRMEEFVQPSPSDAALEALRSLLRRADAADDLILHPIDRTVLGYPRFSSLNDDCRAVRRIGAVMGVRLDPGAEGTRPRVAEAMSRTVPTMGHPSTATGTPVATDLI